MDSAPLPNHKRRVFLFLQGPSSPLFQRIAERLEDEGATCWRVNLNAGDWLFWRRGGAVNYRGSFDRWQPFVRSFLREKGVTDVIALGEERPYHRIAFDEAKQAGARTYVVEMGYLRPDWVTLEREGMSSNSRFPAEPQQILEAARGLPEPDWEQRYRQTFLAEAMLDLAYNLPNVFFWFFYPRYRRHGLFHPLAEYAGWLRRLIRNRFSTNPEDQVSAWLAETDAPFFLYPLQLETDYQLRAHSPFSSQRDAICHVLRSFAAHSPPLSRLLLKVHPLDNDLIAWKAITAQFAADLGIQDRIIILDGGNLERLIEGARGVVTVNSTAALPALREGKPVKVLGQAVYDVAGLTNYQPLDTFWTAPQPPAVDIADAFFRLLAATIQVRGNFYSKAGLEAASVAIAERLLTNCVNEPGGYVSLAPR